MLFNSVEFIAGFLPVVLIGFFVLTGSGRQRLAVIWLTVVSLVFYGWWNPVYVPLLVGSMLVNYLLGGYLRRHPSRLVLGLAVAANVLLLVYYKYTGFLLGTLDAALDLGWRVEDIILPLAISFFTFQQIAYLVDAHDGVVEEHDFANYCLFISFFPQLIAGPITHHAEMLAQFNDRDSFRARIDNLSLGATVFLLGLFKKVVIADTLALKATPVFSLAADGTIPAFYDAWTGALTYTLQIYFDFSGYSDMAIGLALLFGISLPANFNSPFKACNVIDYWSRWHMTLTRFLTAYIYNPIVLRVTRARMVAGKPQPRRGKMTAGTFFALVAYPTVFTMFISGIWHGAGWHFVAFGLLHGFYLVVAHGWRAWKPRQGWKLDSDIWWHKAAAVALTFGCVVVAVLSRQRRADRHGDLRRHARPEPDQHGNGSLRLRLYRRVAGVRLGHAQRAAVDGSLPNRTQLPGPAALDRAAAAGQRLAADGDPRHGGRRTRFLRPGDRLLHGTDRIPLLPVLTTTRSPWHATALLAADTRGSIRCHRPSQTHRRSAAAAA